MSQKNTLSKVINLNGKETKEVIMDLKLEILTTLPTFAVH